MKVSSVAEFKIENVLPDAKYKLKNNKELYLTNLNVTFSVHNWNSGVYAMCQLRCKRFNSEIIFENIVIYDKDIEDFDDINILMSLMEINPNTNVARNFVHSFYKKYCHHLIMVYNDFHVMVPAYRNPKIADNA